MLSINFCLPPHVVKFALHIKYEGQKRLIGKSVLASLSESTYPIQIDELFNRWWRATELGFERLNMNSEATSDAFIEGYFLCRRHEKCCDDSDSQEPCIDSFRLFWVISFGCFEKNEPWFQLLFARWRAKRCKDKSLSKTQISQITRWYAFFPTLGKNPSNFYSNFYYLQS